MKQWMMLAAASLLVSGSDPVATAETSVASALGVPGARFSETRLRQYTPRDGGADRSALCGRVSLGPGQAPVRLAAAANGDWVQVDPNYSVTDRELLEASARCEAATPEGLGQAPDAQLVRAREVCTASLEVARQAMVNQEFDRTYMAICDNPRR